LESQGVGSGSSTTELEAKTASQILSDLGIKNPVAFDIGANIGNWSRALVHYSPNSVSYAFEPSIATFKSLINCTKNSNNIFPINVGMGERAGIAKLFTNEPGSGFASLSLRRLNHFDISMDKSEEIQLDTIDNFIESHGIFPTIVKLDIEGHELAALQRATASISRIPVIQFEFGGCNLDTHTTFQDFWYFFTERDFEIYRLGPNGIVRLEKYLEIFEIYLTTNYFAIAKNYKPDNLA
jgi:FkbM family methyltransferase